MEPKSKTPMIKKTIHFIFATALLSIVAISSYGQMTGNKTKKPTKKLSTSKPVVPTTELAEGQALIAKSDCSACHKPDAKLIRPAYNAISEKYTATEANYIQLSNKVIKGGSGVWGEIPMPPHPSLSNAEAKKMIQYILSVR